MSGFAFDAAPGQDDDDQRPGTSTGEHPPAFHRPSTRATASPGRPTTSASRRPGTSASSRPITAGGRRTQDGPADPDPAQLHHLHHQQWQYPLEEYDEYDEEEYDDEEEDDEDVFAFVPPDIGPSPALAHVGDQPQALVTTPPKALSPVALAHSPTHSLSRSPSYHLPWDAGTRSPSQSHHSPWDADAAPPPAAPAHVHAPSTSSMSYARSPKGGAVRVDQRPSGDTNDGIVDVVGLTDNKSDIYAYNDLSSTMRFAPAGDTASGYGGYGAYGGNGPDGMVTGMGGVGMNGMRLVEMEMEIEEDSPYPEVRASVSNVDDPDMPVLTVRMWFLGLLFTVISSALNMFLYFRYPAPQVSPIVVQLVVYPLGKFLAWALPIRTFHTPSWMGGLAFSLNPGPFNIKEHACISIMANVAIGPAYAMNTIVVQDSNQFYANPVGMGFTALLILSTQCIGFGLAGVCRRFLVWPASMIWPQNLVTATILNTFHAEEDGEDGTMTRFKFFSLASIAAFFWYFLPGFLFQALSAFSWVCWIWPNSVPVNQLFGVESGLGMGIFTFDWSEIAFIGSPMVPPWWAEANVIAGFVFFYWLVAPILYFTNTWDFAYLPVSSGGAYDRYGNEYQVDRVLTADKSFDPVGYANYSPLYLSTTYAMVYILGFATSSSVIIHCILYHGKSIYKGIRQVKSEEDDVHAKFMRNYPEVPDWWYLSFLLLFFALAIIACEVYSTSMPVWAVLLALAIPAIYVLPAGFIYAMTGQGIGTNLWGELIPGYILRGKPLANMIFKSFSVQSLLIALSFVQDLKLGHYMKIPPRATFQVQIVSTLVSAFVQLGVKEWLFANVSDLCASNNAHHLTCPHYRVFYTASIVWGVIGPDRLFGYRSIYHPALWSLLFGAFIPVPFWLLGKRYTNSWIKYISWPVILTGSNFIPPGTGINYSSWALVGFIFQYVMRRRNFRWWSKYNFVLSAALDSGTILSTLFIFFALQFPKNGSLQINWWGNTVFLYTSDSNFIPLKSPPPGGFGPSKWS